MSMLEHYQYLCLVVEFQKAKDDTCTALALRLKRVVLIGYHDANALTYYLHI